MNIFVKRMISDEDGVALAFGITFFLLVFLLGMSIYAAGETVRQRMELQNAADAAAYSGAVVQADTLSRVACINRAMSWTYVMMNRRIMDYITDKWLEKVEQEWDRDFRSVREQWNWQSTCGTRREGSDFWTGFGGNHKQIFLNRSQMVNIENIKRQRKEAAGKGKGYRQLAAYIGQDRKTLAAMYRVEQSLLDQMPSRIENAVKAAVDANISETPNDSAGGGALIAFKLLQEAPSKYTEIMPASSENERRFLVFGEFEPDVREISMRGIDKWYLRSPGIKEGFHREYVQKSNHLIAEWQWFGIKYINTGKACVPHLKGVGSNSVRGLDVQDDFFSGGEVAMPARLKEEFFGRDGALLVGVKRKLNNPFAFLFASGNVQGLFRAFSPADNNRFMWTLSAARAGYASPLKKDRRPGAYETTFLRVAEKEEWNLCETDWDALMLPAANAFDKGTNRNFERSGEPLMEMYGLLAPGTLAAPPGMKGSGTLDLKKARKLLKH